MGLLGSAARARACGSVLLAELVHAASRIDNLLLAGIEGVAVRAHFDLQIVSEGRAGLERVAARAADRNLFVFGMACGFHCLHRGSGMDADRVNGGDRFGIKGRGSLAACLPFLKPQAQGSPEKLERVHSSKRERVRASVSLSTEPVDNSVDFSDFRGQKRRAYCIFVTLVKK